HGHITAALVHALITEGAYRRHLAETRRRLAGAMVQAAAELRACGLETWAQPRGGFFLWMRLPDGRDGADVARRALARGMVLAPGTSFSLSDAWNGYMRFNVAHCADPRIRPILREALG
ncbi:aminotransferase class I/II-fold pyridoxal phosphate-dependent enzyme, partial [Methylobacterium sp. B1]|uniref:aminotransferase class I/II-fold pyridoxal phosphate-dependent enzyme n=1 Tax=Methylobacterium sp. B1 TaxID=91459 RepID=UPI0005BDFA1A